MKTTTTTTKRMPAYTPPANDRTPTKTEDKWARLHRAAKNKASRLGQKGFAA